MRAASAVSITGALSIEGGAAGPCAPAHFERLAELFLRRTFGAVNLADLAVAPGRSLCPR